MAVSTCAVLPSIGKSTDETFFCGVVKSGCFRYQFTSEQAARNNIVANDESADGRKQKLQRSERSGAFSDAFLECIQNKSVSFSG